MRMSITAAAKCFSAGADNAFIDWGSLEQCSGLRLASWLRAVTQQVGGTRRLTWPQ